jgi:hypothetical protein
MKKLLLALALTLSASALARAQAGGLERRIGDMFFGPVREARIETAVYVRRGDETTEGPRLLTARLSYTPDGKRSDAETYGMDGNLVQRFVRVYDDAGQVVEQENYDGQNRLVMRVVSRPDAGEELTYDGDGNLKGTRTYDAADIDRLWPKAPPPCSEEGSGGSPERRTRQTCEYDSRGNVSRLVTYLRVGGTAEYLPTAVTYYTVTYYQ